MKKEEIDLMLSEKMIRKRSPDRFRAESLIKAALVNADFARMSPVEEKTATGIFRELYEAFRQLGDAKWWMLGYEPVDSHKASMKVLMSAEIRNSFKLQTLDRLRIIRNDANYRGELVKKEQAVEILSLWNEVSENLIKWIKK